MRLARYFALLSLCSASAAAASPLDGLWLTDDHKGVVRVGPCSPGNVRVCGWIVRVLDSGPNVPTRDVNNPNPALRSRTILGMPVLSGFVPYSGSYIGGSAYDPKSGRSYRASLKLDSAGALDVTGCVLIVCRTVVWTRAH